MEVEPLLPQILSAPASSVTIILLCALWIIIQLKKLDYHILGFNYLKVGVEGEYWRFISSSLSHISIIHLVFNVASLWSCRQLEIIKGQLYYVKSSVILAFFSLILMMCMQYILIRFFHKNEQLHVFSLGYSCVVFGLMSILCMMTPEYRFNILGVSVPITIAPFSSLIFTQLLVPNASFIGHLAGVLVGFAIFFGIFDWMSTVHFVLFSVWMGIASLYSLQHTFPSLVKFIPLYVSATPVNSLFHLQQDIV
eukprot:TRINITY_DN7455_c0_g1_i1.p1 TRINITY_DN7455_c0_g1~~TRINITY_DN7455_c0_g1_i1.p1  ORF type:complete len:252 (-),score=17.84 TRINITY_DN7455_c0_g1_i1:10-765(-)